MLIRRNLYERREPVKDATLFLIFCEGSHTEPKYFGYFNEINSQVRIIPVPADSQGNNSPIGLYESAVKTVLPSEENPHPKFQLIETDQLWFVVDTDQWGQKLVELREKCNKHSNWNVAQSNPCFEVWLYFHTKNDVPNFNGVNESVNWKKNLNEIITGGFDFRKHPIFIKQAINNSKANFIVDGGEMVVPYTEVFKLAEGFYPIISSDIEKALVRLYG